MLIYFKTADRAQVAHLLSLHMALGSIPRYATETKGKLIKALIIFFTASCQFF